MKQGRGEIEKRGKRAGEREMGAGSGCVGDRDGGWEPRGERGAANGPNGPVVEHSFFS
jgi:hypothetical protein